MADTGGQEPDPRDQVQAVLRRSVTDFGPAVLSNPTILEGVCEDRLPESPREASLISAAARFDVASMLAQQVPGVGPDGAVRLTASNLAESRSLDPDACLWVVSEFARAMGHEVSQELLSADSGSVGAPPPPPPAPPTVMGSRPEAETIPPGPFVPAESVAAPEGSGGALFGGASADEAAGPAPATTRNHLKRNLLVGGVGVVAIVLIVLFTVGPFSSSTTSPYNTLASYIPSAVSGGSPTATGSHCSDKLKLVGDETAYFGCDTSSTNLPVAAIVYILFPNKQALDAGYKRLLSKDGVVEDEGSNCGSFSSFTPPCETAWNFKKVSEGRVMEYTDTQNSNAPAIVATVERRFLLIGIEGSNGNDLFQWWSHNHWTTAGTLKAS